MTERGGRSGSLVSVAEEREGGRRCRGRRRRYFFKEAGGEELGAIGFARSSERFLVEAGGREASVEPLKWIGSSPERVRRKIGGIGKLGLNWMTSSAPTS